VKVLGQEPLKVAGVELATTLVTAKGIAGGGSAELTVVVTVRVTVPAELVALIV